MQKTIKAGRPTIMFGSVINEGDTYVVTGVTSNPALPYYGRGFIGRLDDEGNIITVTYIYDSVAKKYGTFFNCLSKTDKGYRFTGYTLDTNPRILLINTDENFTPKVYEYGTEDLFAYQGHYNIELHDYIYIAGLKTISGKSNISLIKSDSIGEIIWEQIYGLPGVAENATSLTKLNSGTLMIGSLRTDLFLGNETSNTWLLEVDTAGEIVRQWLDASDSTYGAYGLKQTSDGGFFYASQKKLIQTPGDVRPVGIIVRMDSQFNKLWQYEGNRSSPYTGLYDVEQLPDGGFVACGSRHIVGSDSTGISAWVVKLSFSGQEVWSREYSGSTYPGTYNFLNDIDVMPNGNLVAVGETQDFSDSERGQMGLLLVMDSNGCVIENCTVGIDDMEPKVQMKVYPNPFIDEVSISVHNAVMNDATVTVTNPLGQVLHQAYGLSLSDNYTVDLSGLSAGLYFIAIEAEGERIVKQVVKE